MSRDRLVLQAFAELLRYPAPGIAERARACARALTDSSPGAARRLERFAHECEASAPERLEELYTAAFDLGPLCIPYVGHHLFGEGRERAMFLARLRAMERDEGFLPGSELPDHVCEVLLFLAAARDHADRDALLHDGLAPAAEKMLQALAEARHPWADVLAALCEALRRLRPARPSAPAPLEVLP
jgi:nitrate reductase delta subunit